MDCKHAMTQHPGTGCSCSQEHGRTFPACLLERTSIPLGGTVK